MRSSLASTSAPARAQAVRAPTARPRARPFARSAPHTRNRRDAATITSATVVDMTTSPLATSSAHLTLTRPNGDTVTVGELTEGKTVMVFLRHLGCPFCWEFAKTVLTIRPQLAERGYTLALVSIGDADGAVKFCEKLPCDEDVLLVDESMRVYEALGLTRGVRSTFLSPKTGQALAKRGTQGLREATAGYTPIAPKSAQVTLQQGGAFVFDGIRVLYGWRDEATGDHVKLSDLLDTCVGDVDGVSVVLAKGSGGNA